MLQIPTTHDRAKIRRLFAGHAEKIRNVAPGSLALGARPFGGRRGFGDGRHDRRPDRARASSLAAGARARTRHAAYGGERISMALLSMALRDQGEQAISFTGRRRALSPMSHTRARILEIRPVRVRRARPRPRRHCRGFSRRVAHQEVTTLGRGGSDTTAVALAAALGAERCEVYTDVPGIYSADPRLVPGARRYERLPLDLVFEMAVKGAQVMHARSIEIARSRRFSALRGAGAWDRAWPKARCGSPMRRYDDRSTKAGKGA